MLRNLLKNVRRPVIDFETFKKPRKPNVCVMAPHGLCSFPPHIDSPAFNISREELIQRFETIFFSLPNTELLTERQCGPEGRDTQREYVHTSRLIGFPDTVTVRFMSIDEKTSTLAIISRSHYGYRDLGVNRGRVMYCMNKLVDATSNEEA